MAPGAVTLFGTSSSSLICAECRLVQGGGFRCRACGRASLRSPSDAGLLSSPGAEPLEHVSWRAMSPPRLLATLALLVIALPMATYRLTGSRLLEVAALSTVIYAPWLRALISPMARALRWRRARALAVAPSPLLLGAGEPARRGVARGSGVLLRAGFVDGPCLAASWRAGDTRGVYLWQQESVDFDVVADGGAVRVMGTLALFGDAAAGRLPIDLPGELDLPGEVGVVVLRDGDEVELRGPIVREQVAAGYRDAAEMDVMRGVPGRPVEVRRLARARAA